MTLTRRLVLMAASCTALAILVISLVFGLLGRNALIAQAEGQAQAIAGIIAESARLAEVSLEETQSVVTDVLTTLALAADHISETRATDISDRLAEIVARGGLDSMWLIDEHLNVIASSIGDYSAVLRGETLPDNLARDALQALVSGRKFSVDFGPAVNGVRFVGVRAPDHRALIAGQPVRVLDGVRAANSVPVLLEALLDRDNILSIQVLDDTQKELAKVGDQPTPPKAAELAVNAVATGEPDSALIDAHFWVAAPVRDMAGIVIGATVIEMSNHRLNRLLFNLLFYGAGSALVVLAAGVAIAAISAGRIARPVAAMTRAAYEIDARTFEPSSLDPLVRHPDELGTLARVFQHMAIEVQRREELLESQVRARTLELEQKNALLEEAARRVETELAAARLLQTAMLPQSLPLHPSYAGKAAMLPARDMSGDFYDFFALDERRLGLVIADVSGKGVPAAFFMAISRTVLQSSAQEGRSAGDCLSHANSVLCGQNPMELFVTAFYGILDTVTGELAYANGGHNPPLVIRRADGEVAQVPRSGGMALGILPGVAYAERVAQLHPGDTLFLYTDGISEAMDADGHEFTETRLRQALGSAQLQSVDRVLSTVTDAVDVFVGGAPQSDDITCLVIRYIGPPPAAA